MPVSTTFGTSSNEGVDMTDTAKQDRPPALKVSRSFSRLETLPINATSRGPRSRSSTLSTVHMPEPAGEIVNPSLYHDTSLQPNSMETNLVLAKSKDILKDGGPDEQTLRDELPIEVVTLTDRFAHSLTAPVHPAPLATTAIAELFQNFYEDVSRILSTHISHLQLSIGSLTSNKSEQQMLSIDEISRRKRERKLLEIKKFALEEEVEKDITERLYSRIWRHKESDDEARDEALRSKILAFAVLDVGLKELGVEPLLLEDIKPAMECLITISKIHHPLGKLKVLKHTHKLIVDALAKSSPSSAKSADNILPTLIYVLTLCPPLELSIISDLHFIQRFRCRKAIDGEAAYCLTNMEAATSFLETVDLQTLSNDVIGDDLKDGVEAQEKADNQEEIISLNSIREGTSSNLQVDNGTTGLEVKTLELSSDESQALRNIQTPIATSKKASYLTPVEFATSAASTAVNTADQSLKTIGSTLETSYKFLFGKMSDRKTDMPKTLDDARKLVGTPTMEVSGARTSFLVDAKDIPDKAPSEVSSTTQFINTTPLQPGTVNPLFDGNSPVGTAAESVRNLGSHLGRFAGNIRSFSRTQINNTPPSAVSREHLRRERQDSPSESRDLIAAFPELEASLQVPPTYHAQAIISKPIARFLTMDVNDMKIGDVQELLHDYKRLSSELENLGLLC